MNKEMLEILYGDMEEEQLKLLVETKDTRYADKTFWKARKELEASLNHIVNKSKDIFGKPGMVMMNPRMHAMVKDIMGVSYTVDKGQKKK